MSTSARRKIVELQTAIGELQRSQKAREQEANRPRGENEALRDFIVANMCQKEGMILSVAQSPTTGKFHVALFTT